ncbi:uncharacterized protein LOC132639372 [Lycium barbarum]|uniref:uncharacterized protein LOC132639372 n=1 Tax=Lycium barbarum TaxID=112863 RepID=UPI00293F23AB|nr:uncharacterized protein LOC132639372 [Lycium barbarum]
MMIARSIQKEIMYACAKETMKAIVEDLNGDYFGILVDESKDVSHKEQMRNNEDTTAIALKYAIYSLLLEHSLIPSQTREQGYDGASNMQGKINGFKTLVLEDNPSAYCIHCFAHQLQLTFVTVAKKHYDVDQFFDIVANVLNIIGGSFKRREIPREDQRDPWQKVMNDIKSFEFVRMLQLMLKVLAIKNDLNMTLQRKYQDIVNTMKLVGFAKRQLQTMRESKWKSWIEDVSSFCVKHDILIPEMDKNYHIGKSKCKSSSVTYSHHFLIEVFNAVIDLQLAELNSRFDAVNSDLLLDLSYELDNYILFVREDSDFSNLKGLRDLSETLVETNLHKTWRLVYLLVKLSLILPLATARVERPFSSMNYIKNDL